MTQSALRRFIAASVIVLGVALAVPAVCQAWNDDVHYHMSYYLSRQAGFDAATARFIAGYDDYTDYHPWTEAGVSTSYFAQEQKRFWHFPKWAAFSAPDARRNNFYAQVNLYNSMDYCDIVGLVLSTTHSGAY